MKLLSTNENGIYCAQGDFYIDPWKPVKHALITHAHADHARWGNQKYLCHTFTEPILRLRLGENLNIQTIDYKQQLTINGVKVTFFPAGHVIGSAQIRLEYKGEIWVVTGDYKLYDDGTSTPYEPVKCHHFITESTFGLPIYQFESPLKVFKEIEEWWKENQSQELNTIVMCYSLGKAQSILNSIDQSIGDIYVHPAVYNINKAFEKVGFHFEGEPIFQETDKKLIKNSLIICPPASDGSTWQKKLGPSKKSFCSGWMQVRGARRRRGVDKGFVFSDHCDFKSLNQAIKNTEAENIYVTHGYEIQFTKWINEELNLNGQILNTLFNDNNEEE
ncbi:ligase-associated DNA damage response exonuclease [Empedobacter brevis]|uniref:ligase-associated DNA damage response exonuclease n=1 Tax=Empedobacter brevis TaxID=247 RepID=UPI0039B01733